MALDILTTQNVISGTRFSSTSLLFRMCERLHMHKPAKKLSEHCCRRQALLSDPCTVSQPKIYINVNQRNTDYFIEIFQWQDQPYQTQHAQFNAMRHKPLLCQRLREVCALPPALEAASPQPLPPALEAASPQPGVWWVRQINHARVISGTRSSSTSTLANM